MVNVSVILINYENVKYTVPCIEELRKQSYSDFEIIVVDNGSKGNDADVLEKVKGIRLIRENKNHGFAGGNNIGVKSANGKYIALLNNDTLVEKDWLKELVKAIESNRDVGIVGSKAYNKYDKSDYSFTGYGTTTVFGLQANIDVDKDIKEAFPVFAVSGGSMLFRKVEVGEPFDEDYFIYSEDAALCWRLRLKGKNALMVPRSIFFHEGEIVIKSHKGLSNFFWYLGERNRLLNFFLCYSPRSILLLLPPLCLLELSILLGYPSKSFYKLKGYGWLLIHFKLLLKKRKVIQRQRKVGDKEVIQYMSTKIIEETKFENSALRFCALLLNKINKKYCSFFGYKTKY